YPEAKMGLVGAGYLRRHWGRNRPDLIHIATEGLLGYAALRAAKSLQIPVIASFHTNFHHYTEHYGVPWLRGAMEAYLRWFHNQARCNLVPDQTLMLELEQVGFRNNRHFGRGVDTTLFDPQKRDSGLRESWGAGETDLVLVHVSRVAAEKNTAFVLDLYRKLRKQNPGLRCVVVGDGPLRGRLQRDYPEVHFAGFRFGEDLARHYASGDLFYFASETETFGNVVTEAMASGLAVLTYDYAAARQMITHGLDGLKVELGEAENFIRLGMELTQSAQSERRKALGSSARAKALTLPWSGVVDRYEEIILEALISGQREVEGVPVPIPSA
ncbi:MAG: glycosyltransferase family 1 protein, partial [Blastochloris sp.]|nr:glycosyltransferase family 1 protein [Blastochloris sp.]